MNTIEKLIERLHKNSISDYMSILERLDMDLSKFSDFISWSDESYTRNYIYKCAQFELVLMCWNKNQGTKIHNHNGQCCWLYVVQGALNETFYTLENQTPTKLKESVVTRKQISYIDDDFGYHKLHNDHPQKSISLHLYAKPISGFSCYDEASKSFYHKTID